MSSDFHTEITRLLDERAIVAALHRYTRGADQRDIDVMRSAYHADATDSRGEDGTATSLLDTLDVRLAKYTSTMHCVSNIEIDIDGDVAAVQCYSRALHLLPGDDGQPITIERNGRYVDRFEKRAGEWRIADRRLVRTWIEQRSVTHGV